jgi:hemoglobin
MGDRTLYDRLGGRDAIAAVVDRFYERVLADERLAHFFEDVDMRRQRAHQTQFLSAVTGGPVEYTGQDMERAHEDLRITGSHFDAIGTHLERTLDEFDVDPDAREETIETFSEYEEAVVTV